MVAPSNGSDAWVLASIAFASARGPASLRSIIATGDWMNHAILSVEELEHGLARLLRDGWIREESGSFTVTPKFAAAFPGLPRAPMMLMKQIEPRLGLDGDVVPSSPMAHESIAAAIKAYADESNAR